MSRTVRVIFEATGEHGEIKQRVTWEQEFPGKAAQTRVQFPVYQRLEKLMQDTAAGMMKADGLEDTRVKD